MYLPAKKMNQSSNLIFYKLNCFSCNFQIIHSFCQQFYVYRRRDGARPVSTGQCSLHYSLTHNAVNGIFSRRDAINRVSTFDVQLPIRWIWINPKR